MFHIVQFKNVSTHPIMSGDQTNLTISGFIYTRLTPTTLYYPENNHVESTH